MGKFTSIQIKLTPGADAEAVRDRLRNVFDPQLYTVSTWQDNQAMLLHAIQTETMVLNILLFFIIAVAGFGILAIFYMIVVEKTRDIGILKSLGASGRGVMGIFLAYGLSLGIVGAGAGTLLGVTFSCAHQRGGRPARAHSRMRRCSTLRCISSTRFPRSSTRGRLPGSRAARSALPCWRACCRRGGRRGCIRCGRCGLSECRSTA